MNNLRTCESALIENVVPFGDLRNLVWLGLKEKLYQLQSGRFQFCGNVLKEENIYFMDTNKLEFS